MTDFAKRFSPELDVFLKEHQLVVQEDHYDEKCFGNAYLIASDEVLVLRFVRDRSQYFIDIKLVEEDKWHQLSKILKFLKAGGQPSFEIKDVIWSLDHNFQKITDLFSSKDNLSKLVAFEKK